MKPKLFVGMSIMFAILVAGIILVLGLSSHTMLPVYLLSFFLAFFAVCTFLIREALGEKILVASVILVLLAISTTMFLVNLKMYHEVLNEYGNPSTTPEIELMQLQNQYYLEYANYLNIKVSEYQMKIAAEQVQLIELNKLKQELTQSGNIAPDNTSQTTVPQDSYTLPQYTEYEGENND